jgi:hypothetical protein
MLGDWAAEFDQADREWLADVRRKARVRRQQAAALACAALLAVFAFLAGRRWPVHPRES